MENYPSNSYRNREQEKAVVTGPAPEKKIEKVTTGVVKTKKKNTAGIIFEQDLNDIKDFVIKERAVPAIKQMVFDFIDRAIGTVRDSAHMMIFKNTDYDPYDGYYNYNRTSRPRSMQERYSFSSYNSNLRPRNEAPQQSMASANSYDDIIFETRADAESVIQQLIELVDTYGTASIADLYAAAGVTSKNYMHNDYGWRDLSSASVDRTRDGYLVKLPRARPLN